MAYNSTFDFTSPVFTGVPVAPTAAAATNTVQIATTAFVEGELARPITNPGAILSSSPSAGIGYTTGSGGQVTQATSRTTGVTLNNVTGRITLFSAAGSATPQVFTVTNSAVGASDTVIANVRSGTTDTYRTDATAVAAGSFKLAVTDLTGTATEAPIIMFAVIKGSPS